MHCYSPCPQLCSRPPLTYAFAGGSPPPAGKSPGGSLLLSPGSWCTRFCCALQECISQSCVSSGSSMVGLMATSPKRTYATATPRAPVPAADHCRPGPPQETLTVLSQSLWGPWVLVRTGLFEPSEHLWRERGLILNVNSPLLLSCWGFSFAHGRGASPHSHSSAYRLTGVSLMLDVGHLHTASPVKHSCCSCLGREVSQKPMHW